MVRLIPLSRGSMKKKVSKEGMLFQLSVGRGEKRINYMYQIH
jgi:hypothetical protein